MPSRKARSASPVAVEMEEETWRTTALEDLDFAMISRVVLVVIASLVGGENAGTCLGQLRRM